jgi:hypothetical protein
MEKKMLTSGFSRSQRFGGRGLRMALAILIALTLMTVVSLAQSSDSSWTIHPDANPGMPVAQWYMPAAASSTPGTSWTIHPDAHPGMPVAQWYMPAAASSAPGASWTIHPEAHPGMPVAQWYMPAAVTLECSVC